jgi:ribosomal protein L27
MAHKKGAGSSDNGRDSNPQYLGVKMFGGQTAIPGNILVRQRGTKFHPGAGVYMGKDHTLHASISGIVTFKKGKDDRRVVFITPYPVGSDAALQTAALDAKCARKVRVSGTGAAFTSDADKAEKADKVATGVAARAAVATAAAVKGAAKAAAPKPKAVATVVSAPVAAAPAVVTETVVSAPAAAVAPAVVTETVVSAPAAVAPTAVTETIVSAPVAVAPTVVTETVASAPTTTSTVISPSTTSGTTTTTTTRTIISGGSSTTPSTTTTTSSSSTPTTTVTSVAAPTTTVVSEAAASSVASTTATVVSEGTEEVTESAPQAMTGDDLKKIEGIGPKIAELFYAAGITTFEQLSETSTARMQEILDGGGPRYATHNPMTWGHQASLAADGQWDELKELQDELNGGRA